MIFVAVHLFRRKAVQRYASPKWPRADRVKGINAFAKQFRDKLDGILNSPKVGVVVKANELLAHWDAHETFCVFRGRFFTAPVP